jgi:hypothetical protein
MVVIFVIKKVLEEQKKQTKRKKEKRCTDENFLHYVNKDKILEDMES